MKEVEDGKADLFFYPLPDLWWKDNAAVARTVQDHAPHVLSRTTEDRDADGVQCLSPFNKFPSPKWINLDKSFTSVRLCI